MAACGTTRRSRGSRMTCNENRRRPAHFVVAVVVVVAVGLCEGRLVRAQRVLENGRGPGASRVPSRYRSCSYRPQMSKRGAWGDGAGGMDT